MRTIPGLLTIIATAVLWTATASAQSSADLLRQGIQKEEADPAAAAKLYQQIIADAEAARPAQAEAYFRLAEHFAKQGQTQKAAELYGRIVRDYSDQKQFHARALAEQARLEPAGASAAPAVVGATPAIVTTAPEALQNDIDPALDRIEVTFDQPMRDNSWSWTGGGDTYPDPRGKPSYDEKRLTCTMPVKLRPAKVYWVGINSPSFRNFISEKGEPAEWYVILFATRSADGKPTVIPMDLLRRARAINKAHERPQPAADRRPQEP